MIPSFDAPYIFEGNFLLKWSDKKKYVFIYLFIFICIFFFLQRRSGDLYLLIKSFICFHRLTSVLWKIERNDFKISLRCIVILSRFAFFFFVLSWSWKNLYDFISNSRRNYFGDEKYVESYRTTRIHELIFFFLITQSNYSSRYII